ncbi:transposase, partial [Candidatus Micrarchaeota archaeon]|nr:transposase [Candidatus Micrarchaeota archaeon]
MREKRLFSWFKNDTIARAYFSAMKWRGSRRCPACSHERKIYRLNA